MAKLENKIALVTGASKGIGAGIAKALAREGATVIINYSSDEAAADSVVAEIKAGGSEATAIRANVAKSEDIERLLREVQSKFERLDVLVNNVGIFAHVPLSSVTEDLIDRLFDTNVKGVLLTTKAAIPLFPATGGSIVNIGSLASAMPSAGLSVFGATKGAMDVITGDLSKELGPKGIRVNCVRPGFTSTEGLEAQGLKGGNFEKQAVGATPLGRAGQPDDIADIVVFLASADSRWVTGSLINAAGGLTY